MRLIIQKACKPTKKSLHAFFGRKLTLLGLPDPVGLILVINQ